MRAGFGSGIYVSDDQLPNVSMSAPEKEPQMDGLEFFVSMIRLIEIALLGANLLLEIGKLKSKQ
jgi:hypothetical protein